jgi:hypothetical protein
MKGVHNEAISERPKAQGKIRHEHFCMSIKLIKKEMLHNSPS